MRRRHRGITLSEALVAAALTVVVGVLLAQLIRSGLGAHEKGTRARTAQAAARSVVSLLVSELRSSVTAPFSTTDAISPVFWPGVWGADQEGSPSEPFFLRELTTLENDVEVDRSHNRLLYIRTNDVEPPPGSPPLDAYALVELRINKEQPNLLERRVMPLSGADSPVQLKDVQGADGAVHQAWVVELDNIDEDLPAEVLHDSGKDSRLAFRVSHGEFEPPSDPGRTRFPELFEPGVFTVDVAVAIGSKGKPLQAWPAKTDWETWRGESTDLRIPSVRSNL